MIERQCIIFFGAFFNYFTSEALTEYNWVKGTHDESSISQNILSENVQRYEKKSSMFKTKSVFSKTYTSEIYHFCI